MNAGNPQILMGTNLRITLVVILCTSVYIIMPKVAQSTSAFRTLTTDILGTSGSDRATTFSVPSPDLQDIYVPPNYGGPDSQHGSGTR